MARADRFTAANKIPIYYSDFLNNFDLDPVTGQLAILTNENAVANSMKNLVLTNLTERVYHPEIGSKVQSINFDPDDITAIDLIQTSITDTITNQEPRATIRKLTVQADPDNNQMWVTLVFSMINISNPITIAFPISRIR